MDGPSTTPLLHAHATRDVTASADAVWAAVGDFGAISTWHPAVASCELIAKGDSTFRLLTLGNGATLLEKLVRHDEAARTYTYTIEEGPLPVAGYTSTIKVTDGGSGAILNWVGTFTAKGASESDAVSAITGIYEAGLDSLVAKLAA